MSNDSFKFKQFTVHQSRCAMKVGTDGTLLGAWTNIPSVGGRMLDIGTGTGLIALMLAQRAPEAMITGIDIDTNAVSQAHENIEASPFASRIQIVQADVADYKAEPFDVIVSNPPYFMESLTCPDHQRTTARHTASLTYQTLMHSAFRLLTDEGLFSVIIPFDCRSLLESEASLAGFFMSRICGVKTTPQKQPKRYLIEFRKHPVSELDITEGILETEPCVRSEWYQELTKDFYL